MRGTMDLVRSLNTNGGETWVVESISLRAGLHQGYAVNLRYFGGSISIFDSFFWDNTVIIKEMNNWFTNEFSYSTSSD